MKLLKLRYLIIAIMYLLLFSILGFLDPYHLDVLNLTLIYIIAAMGLNLMLGYTGYLSLAPAAFFGIGAYASVLMALKMGAPFWIGMLAAIAASSFFALLVGFPCLRLKGHYFVLVTVAFAEVIKIVARNWVELTGGAGGIYGIPRPVLIIPNVIDVKFFELEFSIMLVVLVSISYLICQKIVNSRLGRALTAIREGEDLAEAIGVNTFKFKMTSFILHGTFSGLAGCVYAHYITAIDPPSAMGFHITANALAIVAIGGAGTLLGPIIGSLIFIPLPELLRASAIYRLVTLGIVLMVVVLFKPRGLSPLIKEASRRLYASLMERISGIGSSNPKRKM